MITIFFPEQFVRDGLSSFFEQLDSHQFEPEILIDCSTLNYSYPVAMLLAGAKLRQWITTRRERHLKTSKCGHDSTKNVHSYLRHLGFFDFIHMGGGNHVGEAQGSMSYLPITKIERPQFDSSIQHVREWYESVIETVRRLANILSGTTSRTEENSLYSYALREIIRNVFEHSEANECYICGQRWYDGRVEVAVIDEGIGISNSLKRSHHITNDADALRMAIRPGVSSTSNIDPASNIYDNSGFGLYVLTEIAKSFGWFLLSSGDAKIIGQSQTIIPSSLKLSGTCFGMRLNKAPTHFSDLLRDIIYAGEQEAQSSGIKTKASGISKLV